jgi:hypothetical protein
MSTFGNMVSRIADELNKTNLNTQIKRSIVTAMKRHRNRRFKFNYASSTFTTSDGQSVYPLPEGFMGDELVEVLDGNFRDTLTKRDYAWIADHDNHTSYQSEPRVYAIIDGSNARLFPTPNATADTTSGNWSILWHYHKDLNAPGISGAISACATDGVTNSWMTDGEELIRLEAKIDIYMNVLRGQEVAGEATKIAPLRSQALNALVKEYEKAVASGQLQTY